MTQAGEDAFSERLAEELVLLYLRLNGYLTLGGYLLHRPLDEGEGLRTEIDALAVRFPTQREPLHGGPWSQQANDPVLVLPADARVVDFVVAEVKTGRRQPRFNDPLLKEDADAQRNLEDLLSMLGCFGDQEDLHSAGTEIIRQLRSPPTGRPATYDLKDERTRIRFILFWEPQGQQTSNRHFIGISHVIEFIENRTRPGVACADYSRWHAKWRGLHRHVLEALDEASLAGRSLRDLASLCDEVLRRLGAEAADGW